MILRGLGRRLGLVSKETNYDKRFVTHWECGNAKGSRKTPYDLWNYAIGYRTSLWLNKY